MSGPFAEAAERWAEEIRQRQATVHERVGCPMCGAAIGARCRRMPLGHGPVKWGPTLKHAHFERLRLDGISLR